MRLAAGAGLALDLHTLLNHTDSRLLALPTTPPRSQIYLHAGAPPESEPYGSDNTVRHRFPIPALLLTMVDVEQRLPENNSQPRIALEDVETDLRSRGTTGEREKAEVQMDLLVRWPLFVVGRINLHD